MLKYCLCWWQQVDVLWFKAQWSLTMFSQVAGKVKPAQDVELGVYGFSNKGHGERLASSQQECPVALCNLEKLKQANATSPVAR